MYVDVVPNRKSPPAYLVRKSVREGDKVKKVTLGNVSFLSPEQLQDFRQILKGDHVAPASFEDSFDILSTTPHGHVAADLGTIEKLKIPLLLGREDCPERRAALALIAGRILSPGSKLALNRHLVNEHSTLGSELGLEPAPGVDFSEDDLYESMRWLLERQPRIENSLAKRHLGENATVLYDLSSSYYEGETCELAKFGHNRDLKKGKKQINYGLLTDVEGRPVKIDVYSGNTADPNTVADQLDTITGAFGIEKAIFIGDRGMLTSKLLEEVAEDPRFEGFGWITSLKSVQIRALVEAQDIHQPELFDERNLVEIDSDLYPGERLVVCRNPELMRKRDHTRNDLLAATEKQLEAIQSGTQRDRNPYHGKDKIARRVERECGKYRMLKHFILEIEEDGFAFRRDQEKIENEARLDGLYVIRSRNVSEAEMDAAGLVSNYKNLSKVESSFRQIKTCSLKVRPIFHYENDMVRAHIFICMLAYYVQWEMEHKLAPLLFRDEEPEAAQAARVSPVTEACRSTSAKAKEIEKKTEEGLPVYSFRGLLENLAGITRVICRPKINGAESFTKIPILTKLQERAFELLNVAVPKM